MSIIEKIKDIGQRVEGAMKRSSFGPRKMIIMGASKDQGLNKIREAAEAGITDMGENYAQELMRKAPLTMDMGIRWHYIGKLQSNKLKHILPFVYSIDSVDSVELAQRIGRLQTQSENSRIPKPIMLQVNLGHERQKSGLSPDVIENLFGDFLEETGVEVVGLMSIPPAHKEAEKMRPYFKQLKELFDRLKTKHSHPERFQVLSMGMSGDFEIAIEEGSNCIRLGTMMFGPRPQREKNEED